MYKIKIALVILFCSLYTYGQKSKPIIKNLQIVHHSEKELYNLSKNELKKLYFERIIYLNHFIPYLALITYSGVSYSEIDIPITIENQKIFDKQEKSIEIHLNESVIFQENIIAYADKQNIIKAIALFEQFIKDIGKLKEE